MAVLRSLLFVPGNRQNMLEKAKGHLVVKEKIFSMGFSSSQL